MKFVVSTLALFLATAVGSAFAAGTAPAKPMSTQQSKMSTCSKDAHTKGLKGDEYKTFMSTCLKGSSTAPAAVAPAATPTDKAASPVASPINANRSRRSPAQQEKMKACNAQATTKALKGPERRKFMSTCLKGDAAAAPAAH